MESTPGPQVRRGPAGPRPAENPVASRLAGRLREIATGAAAPEDMLEPALRVVLEASRVSAGALCLFDQRHDLLRLAAEVGLSDEGCKRLRQVRRGGMAGWDMPLHGLLNRRVYLIESAARNRYVPPLVDAATSVKAVACVPLYAGTTPVASLVLVAIAPERITEEQLAPLSEPLRDLAHMIEAARRRGATAAPAGTPPAPVRPAAEHDRREAARAQSPVTSVAAAEALEAAAEPVGDETRDAERAVEVEGLMARLTEAEAAAERERERLRASEGEREQLAAQLREAAAREERAGDEIARLMADTGTFLAEREQLAEARAREDEARARHADLEMRVEGLRAEREAEAVSVSARLESIAAERDRLSAALAAVQAERDCLAAEATRHVAGEARPPQPGLAPADIVVVDDEPAWAAAAAGGRQVRVIPPGDPALHSLGGTPPACVVVNLAARGALAALATLREAGSSARIWGCLATPGAGRALPLGPVEPVVRPVEPGAVLATLRRHAAGGARILTVGADADALISLRLALVRQGMSVSMAWDGARAVQLFGTERPEIVVIDLALPGHAGYALVAELAARDPPPVAALIPGDDDAGTAFAATLAGQGHAERTLPLGDLVARLLGRE